MALFTRKETKAQISPAEPAVRAAVGGYNPNAAGVSLIGQYYTYQEGEARNRAMTVPAISRARDLHANVISAMPLKMYRERWNPDTREMEDEDLAPRSWLRRPDPSISYETLMSWTFDDLFFFGRAFWYITSRTQDGYPASLRTPGCVTPLLQSRRASCVRSVANLSAHRSWPTCRQRSTRRGHPTRLPPSTNF
jgi:hypothetical protein